ncbi:hypothetical protein ACFRAE_06265 [Sphingobacterium sp. HJSM2_6]|uniref:hypothetical protein n=1 Tax=Sphingobacterium sp. HJSM2_6 TaxID=3366264 RepID=UPI003BBEFA1F
MVSFKHIITTCCLFCLVTLFANAQSRQERFEAIENQKVAFITKHLKLSPAEAQRFFPLYNQYSKEILAIKSKKSKSVEASRGNFNSFRKEDDILEYDSKEVETKKVFRSKFADVIGQARASQFFAVEQEFIKLLYKELDSRNIKHE